MRHLRAEVGLNAAHLYVQRLHWFCEQGNVRSYITKIATFRQLRDSLQPISERLRVEKPPLFSPAASFQFV